MLQIRSVSMAVILSSCNAASNSRLEQTEWAQRCLLETSRAGFGLTDPDRGDRVSSPTTLAAIGEILRGGAGLDQSRWWRVAVARARGLRSGCIGLRSIWRLFLVDNRCWYELYVHARYSQSLRPFIPAPS